MKPILHALLPLLLAAGLAHADSIKDGTKNTLGPPSAEAGPRVIHPGRYEGTSVYAQNSLVAVNGVDIDFDPPFPAFEGQRASLLWQFEFIARIGTHLGQSSSAQAWRAGPGIARS